ncbi:MAG: hypothetical protein HRU20_25190 [Pseudomonadales bacterium]|nr:hypothetical protein [Pseudomonadales bacterium]
MTPVKGWELTPLFLEDATQKLDQWDSEKIDENTLIQYTSVRWGPDTQNPELLKKLQTQKDCDAVTIINFHDSMPGVILAARKQAIKIENQYPDCKVVADIRGNGLLKWQLKRDVNLLLVVSSEGKILFKREGRLSEDEQAYVEYLMRS